MSRCQGKTIHSFVRIFINGAEWKNQAPQINIQNADVYVFKFLFIILIQIFHLK